MSCQAFRKGNLAVKINAFKNKVKTILVNIGPVAQAGVISTLIMYWSQVIIPGENIVHGVFVNSRFGKIKLRIILII